MFEKTARVVAIVTALFLCPISSEGMDLPNSSMRGIDKYIQTSHMDEDKNIIGDKIDRSVYLKVNKYLESVVDILESESKIDSNQNVVGVKDRKEKLQDKLAALSSKLISGGANKPLRDDLCSLLCKPWTDTYYGEYLSQKDFILLGILKDAITQQPLLDDQNIAKLSLKSILDFKAQAKGQWNSSGYQDLLFRQRLDEINRLLERCGVKQKDGIADLSNMPGLDETQRGSIHMTLTKMYMIHRLNKNDINNFDTLEESITTWDRFNDKLDTYTQKRFRELFSELRLAYQDMNYEALSVPKQILHSLNAGDLGWLQKYEQHLQQGKDLSLSQMIDELKKQLIDNLKRENYLDYFTFYRDHPLMQTLHTNVLRTAQNKDIRPEGLIDLFTELSQLRVSINSLGNGRERGLTGFVEGGDTFCHLKAIDWMGVPDRVAKIKETIAIVQSKILQSLNVQRRICVDKLVTEMIQTQKEREEKIKTDLQKKEIWILAMDGGGVRGKIAAEILRDLIHQLKLKDDKKNLSDTFDIVAGTSVGGLIALAMNIPDENGRPAMDENDIATLLETEKASIIFPPKSKVAKGVSQLGSNAYEPTPLENLLLSNFGYTSLSNMRKSTTVMAHSTVDEKPDAFNSCVGSTLEMTVAGSAQSTSAASTYLPPNVQCYNGKVQEYVDGGLTENNPVYEALLDLDNLVDKDRDWKGTKINVLSIGTGIDQQHAPHGRAMVGLPGVTHSLINGTMPKVIADAQEKTVLGLGGFMHLGAIVSYYRLNPELAAPIELDSASEENLAKLRTLVFESILASPFYAQLVKHLAGEQEVTKSQYVEITGRNSDRREEFTLRPPYLDSLKRVNR